MSLKASQPRLPNFWLRRAKIVECVKEYANLSEIFTVRVMQKVVENFNLRGKLWKMKKVAISQPPQL